MTGSEMSDREKRRRIRITRNIFAIADEAGIRDKSDRLDLVRAVLDIGEGIESYTQLSTDDLDDILYGLKAWRSVQELRYANGAMEYEARTLIDADGEYSPPKNVMQPVRPVRDRPEKEHTRER